MTGDQAVRRTVSAGLLLGVLAGASGLAAQDRKGVSAYSAGDFEKATAIFGDAAARSKDAETRCRNLLMMARSCRAAGRAGEAVLVYREVLARVEQGWTWVSSRKIKRDLGWALLESGDPASAVASFAEAVTDALVRERPTDAAEAYAGLAEAYRAGGSPDDALAAQKSAVELSPRDPRMYLALASIYVGMRRYGDALAAANCAADINLDAISRRAAGPAAAGGAGDGRLDAECFLTAGSVRLAMGDLKGALNEFSKAEGWVRNNPWPVHGQGLVHERAGRFPEAAAAWDKAVALVPAGSKASATLLGCRSRVRREMGDRDAARRDAEAACAAAPGDGDARTALAAVRLDEGRPDQALGLLLSVKGDPRARLLEARACAAKGDLERAGAILAKVRAAELMAPRADLANALAALFEASRDLVRERLEKADAAAAAGRRAEALAGYACAVRFADTTTAASVRGKVEALFAADPSLARLPDGARRLALGGDARVKQGRFLDALDEYGAALGLAPFDRRLLVNTALLCGQLGYYRAAIGHLTTVIGLDPEAPSATAAQAQIWAWERLQERR
ncbi:MAG: tetratricopeptide repeat protein [Acidobacteriota bacterium]